MDAIRQYLLTVLTAALICSITVTLLGKKGALAGTVKLLSGVFMAVTVMAPLGNIHFDNLTDFTTGFDIQASEAALEGENSAREAVSQIITQRTRAYILDKAKAMGASLTVEVVLDDRMPPVPCGVVLSGSISPYSRKLLSELIETELGIGTEAQTWTG